MSHNEARDQRRGGRGTVEARQRRRMQPTVLALEPRTLLSNLSGLYGNSPRIGPLTGSTISVASTTGTIFVKTGNGNHDSVTITSNANIVVDLGNGNYDSVKIVDPNGNVQVNVGNGYNDLVTIVGNGTETVTTGTGSGTVSIVGTGTNTVTLGSSGWSYSEQP